jgi:hypothetical protein
VGDIWLGECRILMKNALWKPISNRESWRFVMMEA